MLTPNPFSSGSARWNILAAYGAESKQGQDRGRRRRPTSARCSRTSRCRTAAAGPSLQTFTGGKGDAIITYENEAIFAQQNKQPIDYTVPDSTILIENPIAVTTNSTHPTEAKAFLDFLYSEAGQKIYADNGYRPIVQARRGPTSSPAGQAVHHHRPRWLDRGHQEVLRPGPGGVITAIEKSHGVSTTAQVQLRRSSTLATTVSTTGPAHRRVRSPRPDRTGAVPVAGRAAGGEPRSRYDLTSAWSSCSRWPPWSGGPRSGRLGPLLGARSRPPEAWAAVKLTLVASVIVVALVNLVMGTLIAWVLVRDTFPGKAVLDTSSTCRSRCRRSSPGWSCSACTGHDSALGVNLAYASAAAVLLALLFVTLPFVVRTVQPVLLELDRDMEDAAASLGAGRLTTFRRIILPNLVPAMLGGTALAFARAISEFGSTVLISGNIPFKTEVASVAIYNQIQSDNTTGAAAVSTAAARGRARRAARRRPRPALGGPPWLSTRCAGSPWSTSAAPAVCRSAWSPGARSSTASARSSTR